MRSYSIRTTWTISGAARWLALGLLLVPAGVRGQGAEVGEMCESFGQLGFGVSCADGGQALLVAQPRLLLAQSGGNPVPGTASTLGMRLGSMPRWALGGRLTGVLVGDLPAAATAGPVTTEAASARGVSADLTVGLFGGFSPAPTLGGVLSLDALASAGLVFASEEDGFQDTPILGWGAGARLGILRESFTLPGLSISAMYRDLGEVVYRPRGGEAWRSGLSALSVRGAVSKDLLGFALAAGGGLDRLSADMEYTPLVGGSTLDDLVDTRATAFGSLGFTFLVAHAALELGWQQGADEVPNASASVREAAGSGGWYGSLALRLTI